MVTDKNQICNWFTLNSGNTYPRVDKIFVLKHDNYEQLKNFMINVIPNCYISEDKLNKSMDDNSASASEVLATLIPDEPDKMSGDFGEIITLFFLSSNCEKNTEKVYKWRYKECKNRSSLGTDIILFFKDNESEASTNDFIICAEVKTMATSKSKKPIQNSISGADKDYLTRLTSTLSWLKAKAMTDRDSLGRNFIDRFSNDLIDIPYKRFHKAVSVIESSFLLNELEREFDEDFSVQNDKIEVIVISISELKRIYQDSFGVVLEEESDDNTT